MTTTDEPEPVAGLMEKAAEAMRRAHAAAPPPPTDDELAAVEARRVERDMARSAEILRIRVQRFEESCPARFRSASMDDLAPPMGPEISAWCDGPEGRNLILAGEVGTGKTHAAVAALRVLLPGLLSWEIVSAVELLDRLRPGGPAGELERFSSCSVLLLDDVGAERPTDWTAERMAAVIDRRWLDQRPIVATTNLSLGREGDLCQALGERSYSRLVGSGAVVITFGGGDRRRRA